MSHTSLTEEQLNMLDTWHAIEKDKIPTLLHCINKIALIPQLDERYHLSADEARALLVLSDMLLHLKE